MNDKIRVCIVDDEENVVGMLTEQLSTDDRIKVVGVGANGREAIRLASSLQPDVMLLDITMPQLNGLEAAARITSAFPSIAILIITAHRSEDYVKQALRAGVKDFLEKPIQVGELIERIVQAHAKHDRAATARGLASVWGFRATKASAGCTTLAVNAALDLASLHYRVLLLDLDVCGADCAFLLEQAVEDPVHPLAKLARVSPATAEAVRPLVRTVNLPVEPRLTVDALLGAPSVLPVQAPVEGLRESFDVLCTMYDYIVVDLPPGTAMDPLAGLVLEFAERLFLVTNCDRSSLRALKVTADALATMEWSLDRLSLVLAGLVAGSPEAARKWLVEQKVPLRELFEMPMDGRAFAWAREKRVPVLLGDPRSAYTGFVHQLVDRALNRLPDKGAKPSLWQKLRSMLHA